MRAVVLISALGLAGGCHVAFPHAPGKPAVADASGAEKRGGDSVTHEKRPLDRSTDDTSSDRPARQDVETGDLSAPCATTCGGCCDEKGTCITFLEQTPDQCGAKGATCSACASQANPCKERVCVAGTCGIVDSPVGTSCSVGPQKGACASGGLCCVTCLANGTCHATGTSPAACGTEGKSCEACDDKDDCTTNACVAGKCSYPGSVPNGFPCQLGGVSGKCLSGACCTGCVDNTMTCQPGDQLAHCGNGGKVCAECDDGNDCTLDFCSVASGLCGHSTISEGSPCTGAQGPGTCLSGYCCEGCVQGSACALGIDQNACGSKGQPCVSCLMKSCVSGACK